MTGLIASRCWPSCRARRLTKDGRVAIYSRTMDEITHRFPELVSPLKHLGIEAVIDGEIVPASGQRILPFSELQKRLGRKTIGEDLLLEVPVILVAYDLLYAGGRVLTDQPLAARRQLLEQMIPAGGTIRVSTAKRFTDVASSRRRVQRRAGSRKRGPDD